MSFPPVPCAHCGTNFMRRNLDPDAARICHTCELKSPQKPKIYHRGADVDKPKMLIEIDLKTQAEIEELCLKEGISFSKYFMEAHNFFAKSKCVVNKEEETENNIVEKQKKARSFKR